jgi:hypothetical protein
MPFTDKRSVIRKQNKPSVTTGRRFRVVSTLVVPGLNLGSDTSYPDFLLGFTQFLQTDAG